MTLAALASLFASPGAAQDSAEQRPPTPAAVTNPTSWQWSAETNAFVGVNHQHRKFRDFNAFESQNWLMAAAERPGASGSLRLSAMLSLETWTLQDLGSPQVFQTGETFRNVPLIDRQHPHDLIMGLGGDYRRTVRGIVLLAGADIVGSPALGPPVFMHRPSSAGNPQAPLSHHYLDSTHITPGVIRGGAGRNGWLLEASWFRGKEPDDTRTDLDLGALDSYAARLSWTRREWAAQVSAGRLKTPEAATLYDADKLTASVGYTSTRDRRAVSWLAAFGQKREIHGNLEAYLFEASLRATPADTAYMRLESVAKDILDVGFHLGAFHRHRQSQVSAFTAGYVRDVLTTSAGSFGIGGDITVYGVPANLRESYGSPGSVHVFARFRLRSGSSAGPTHVH